MLTPHRILATTLLLTFATVAPSLVASPQPTPACQNGPALGTWDLPNSSGGTGVMSGKLLDGATDLTKYVIKAQLKDVPTPCLSCITGTINGALYTPSGASTIYVVKGTYSGAFLSGSGTFAANIYSIIGPSTQPVGKITGNFSDPPANSTPGTFNGHWEICP